VRVRKKHQLKGYESILFTYRTCRSFKITACKSRYPYWYVKEMLEYFGYKTNREQPYMPKDVDTEEIAELLRKGAGAKSVAEAYYKSHSNVLILKKKLEQKDKERDNFKFWLKQYNLTEKEVEDWYRKTRKGKTKH
jgi:hypothetical protein